MSIFKKQGETLYKKLRYYIQKQKKKENKNNYLKVLSDILSTPKAGCIPIPINSKIMPIISFCTFSVHISVSKLRDRRIPHPFAV